MTKSLSPQKVIKDTEVSAMDAWIAKLEGQQPPVYEPMGIPVADPSSQLPEPGDVGQAIRFGLVHN